MTLTEVLIAALATWQIIEIWHHGSIFATLRAHVEMWAGWKRTLLLCPFCLSPWVAGAMLLLLYAAQWHSSFGWLPSVFAAARLANLGNDLTHTWCRTPNDQKLVLSGLESNSTIEESGDDIAHREKTAGNGGSSV